MKIKIISKFVKEDIEGRIVDVETEAGWEALGKVCTNKVDVIVNMCIQKTPYKNWNIYESLITFLSLPQPNQQYVYIVSGY